MRDIVVIGASAGGLDAVAGLLAQLPAGLGAAVCVVVHVPADASGAYVHMLGRASALPVRRAGDGDTLYHGNVYVAPPAEHLLVAAGHMRVRRGPKENRARPAIDPLFRSAAEVYGARVVGVLLTGYLDDGVAGLAAIHRAGGLTVVQDPDDAQVPDMPLAALGRVHVDHRLPLHRMGAVLAAALGTASAGGETATGANGAGTPGIESRIAAAEDIQMDDQERLGEPAGFGCPECGGPLVRVHDPDVKRYRCHIGHAYTERALLSDQSEQVERALGAALRTLEERARLLDDMALATGDPGGGAQAARMHLRADEARGHAETLRQLLLRGAADEPAST